MKCPLTGLPCFKGKFFHITDIVDGEPTTSDCCEDCFTQFVKNEEPKEVPPEPTAESNPLEFMKTMVDFIDFLGNPVDNLTGGSVYQPQKDPKESIKKNIEDAKKYLPMCKCGLTILDIQKSGKLGCPQCYTTFEKELKKTLEHYQDTKNLSHVGKRPKNLKPKKVPIEARIKQQKILMRVHIKMEEYEIAEEIKKNLEVLEEKERRKRKLKHKLKEHIKKEEYEMADDVKKQIESIDQED